MSVTVSSLPTGSVPTSLCPLQLGGSGAEHPGADGAAMRTAVEAPGEPGHHQGQVDRRRGRPPHRPRAPPRLQLGRHLPRPQGDCLHPLALDTRKHQSVRQHAMGLRRHAPTSLTLVIASEYAKGQKACYSPPLSRGNLSLSSLLYAALSKMTIRLPARDPDASDQGI